MAVSRIDELYKYKTLPQVVELCGFHPVKLRRRTEAGIFLPPTYVNKHGLRFFNEKWIREDQVILDESFEGKQRAKKDDEMLKNARGEQLAAVPNTNKLTEYLIEE